MIMPFHYFFHDTAVVSDVDLELESVSIVKKKNPLSSLL